MRRAYRDLKPILADCLYGLFPALFFLVITPIFVIAMALLYALATRVFFWALTV